MSVHTPVVVDAEDLERLVRQAHQLNADVAWRHPEEGWACTCGQSMLDRQAVGRQKYSKERRARTRHSEHVAYHVRQALAGRIEFP